ncbi:MAG: hypothetical protein J5608_01280 [Alphaproteobacteria bacterium]|nr:hypothetical protein [Alphaproteobacteria bacterium]
MKLTAKYNLKDIWNKAKSKIDKYGKFVMVGIALGTVVACEKPDPAPEPTPSTPTPVTPTTQKHNVELVYGKNPDSETAWQNISLDTIRKYNVDQTVDTIFMIPENYDQYATFNSTQCNYLISKLRERHNVNPAKVFGKGDLKVDHSVVVDAPEVVRFLEDTLKYSVVYDTKSR